MSRLKRANIESRGHVVRTSRAELVVADAEGTDLRIVIEGRTLDVQTTFAAIAELLGRRRDG